MSGGDQEKIRSVLSLIRELSGQAMRADSAAELFTEAFSVVHHIIAFDLAAAVMLESNLDLHIITREGLQSFINDRLVDRVRTALQNVIPASFTAGDVVVQTNRHTLPARRVDGDCLASEAHAVVHVGDATAGLLLFYRCEPFDSWQCDVIDVFAAEVSMLLEHLKARERILNLADTDDLTGIWNKRYFRRHLPPEIERARIYAVPLSLLMLDVDNFKDVNDSYGHTAGDVVLSELCGAIREMLRPPDLFARFGGDEFAVVLPHTDLSGASSVSDRILQKVRGLKITNEDGNGIHCSISVGVADYQPGDDASDLIRRADERMYVSKRQGKNRYTAVS